MTMKAFVGEHGNLPLFYVEIRCYETYSRYFLHRDRRVCHTTSCRYESFGKFREMLKGVAGNPNSVYCNYKENDSSTWPGYYQNRDEAEELAQSFNEGDIPFVPPKEFEMFW